MGPISYPPHTVVYLLSMQSHSSVQGANAPGWPVWETTTYLGTYAGQPPPPPPSTPTPSRGGIPLIGYPSAACLCLSLLKSLPNACLAPRGSLKKIQSASHPPCTSARLSRLFGSRLSSLWSPSLGRAWIDLDWVCVGVSLSGAIPSGLIKIEAYICIWWRESPRR